MENKSIKDLNIMERYFDFDLSEQELQEFNERVKSDPDFAEKVSQYEFALTFTEKIYKTESESTLKKEQFKSLLNQANPKGNSAAKDSQPEAKVVPINYKKYWFAAAASIALLLMAVWLFSPSAQNPQQLAANYWQETRTSVTTTLKSSTDQEQNIKLLKAADKSFMANNYQEALNHLNEIPTSFKEYNKVLLLKGQSFFGLNQYQNAIESYQLAIEKGAPQQALWYQALAYIRDGNLLSAQQNLNKILKAGTTPALEEKIKHLRKSL